MKIKINKKIFALSLFMILAVAGYFIGDRVWAAGEIDTDDVLVTLTVDEGISITTGADVTMLPNISMSANSSIGSSSWNVKTNSHAGYTLAVKADAAPALVNTAGQSFADYQTGAPTTWNIPDSSYQFGFSAFGDVTDTPTATWGSGGCGTDGVPNIGQKYTGFTGTTSKIITTRNTVTSTSGMDTTICFAAEQKGVYAPSGTYTTTITATATTL